MENISQVVQVKIEDIIPNRYQPRLKFNENDLEELASSIAQYGIIQPLTLRPAGQKLEIIAGERRYKAAIKAGLKTVPAIILNINDQTSAELAIIENIQRKNLNAIEEAKAYKKLLDMSNMTQEDLAKHLGKNQATIANKLRLLNLSDEVQNAVLEGMISERHARTLLKVNDPIIQKEILDRIIKEKLTVKATENLILSEYNFKNSELPNLNNFRIIGDENKMNQQNYNELMQQPAMPIPETPIPNPEPNKPKEISIFTNNFFPSLDDEKTNMNFTVPDSNSPESSITPTQPMMEPQLDQWNTNKVSNSTMPEPSLNINQEAEPNPWSVAPAQPSPQSNPDTVQNLEPNPWNENQFATPQTSSNLTPEHEQNQLNANEVLNPTMPESNLNINQEAEPNPWSVAPAQPLPQSNPDTVQNLEPNPWNGNQFATPQTSSNLTPESEQNQWNTNQVLNPTMPEPSSNSNQEAGPNPWSIAPNQPLPQSNPEIVQNLDSNPWNNNTSNSGTIPSFIDQSISNVNIDNSSTNDFQSARKNINEIINKIRQTISEIESSGYKVQRSEIDMDNEYQIIINIQKGN